MPKDYYKILGVSPQASPREIRTAFQRRSQQLTVQGVFDKDSYQNLREAYRVLSSKKKRRLYDYWHKLLPSEKFDGLDKERRRTLWGMKEEEKKVLMEEVVLDEQAMGEFLNFLKKLTGEQAGRELTDFSRWLEKIIENQNENPLLRSEDAVVRINPPRDLLQKGGFFPIEYPVRVSCTVCRGTGSQGGLPLENCAVCREKGLTKRPDCLVCRGLGYYPKENCRRCKGEGRVAVQKKAAVKIPAKLITPAQLQVKGAGHFGFRGLPMGDLWVEVMEEEEKKKD